MPLLSFDGKRWMEISRNLLDQLVMDDITNAYIDVTDTSDRWTLSKIKNDNIPRCVVTIEDIRERGLPVLVPFLVAASVDGSPDWRWSGWRSFNVRARDPGPFGTQDGPISSPFVVLQETGNN